MRVRPATLAFAHVENGADELSPDVLFGAQLWGGIRYLDQLNKKFGSVCEHQATERAMSDGPARVLHLRLGRQIFRHARIDQQVDEAHLQIAFAALFRRILCERHHHLSLQMRMLIGNVRWTASILHGFLQLNRVLWNGRNVHVKCKRAIYRESRRYPLNRRLPKSQRKRQIRRLSSCNFDFPKRPHNHTYCA